MLPSSFHTPATARDDGEGVSELETPASAVVEDRPVVSVCVLSWNSREVLRQCLQTVYGEPSPLPLEVVLVDNASSDGSPEMVAEEFPQARLLAQNENLMFSRGMNTAARAARGDFLLFLNSDCFITPTVLAELVGFMRENPDALLVSPCLQGADGSIEPAVSEFPGLRMTVRKLLLLPRQWGRTRLTTGPPARVPTVVGACLLARRQLLDEVGLYDESFTMGMEDTDLCRRVQQAGYTVCYLPQRRVIHLNSHSRRKLGRLGRLRHVIDGRLLFAHKHRSLSYRRVWAVLEVPLFVRELLPRLLLVTLTVGLLPNAREGLLVRAAEWRFVRGLWARSLQGLLPGRSESAASPTSVRQEAQP